MTAEEGSEGPQSVEGGVTEVRYGSQTPRIRSKPLDLPTRGDEMIQFCKDIGFPMLPWQEDLARDCLRYKPDGRWAHPLIGIMLPRQQGKSTFMALRILFGIYVLGEKMHLATAHKLTTSSEIFWKIDDTIQSHAKLVDDFGKKYESKGSQEIKLKSGGRYLVRANNSASRGIAAPDTIYMDEVREFHDDEVWSSLRYTQMATPNPQTLIFSNAGDQHSIVLNRLRERGLAAAAGADDRIGWFEWSAEPGCDIRDKNAWMQANPSAGYTISLDNLEAAMSDEESIVRTELLCQWVSVVNPAINPSNWNAGAKKDLKLDREALTWMAIDLSPNRQEGSLVAAQQEGDNINVVLLQTWTNPINLDAKQIANDVADWVRKYQTETVAYSRQTSGAIAALLSPAGISTTAIDGSVYGQACDEMLTAITSGRLFHPEQDEFTRQVLSAVKLPFKDGGWYLGRKVSNATICAAVAMAMVCHFATRGEAEYDIVVG